MKKPGLLKHIHTGLRDACYIWRQEMKKLLRDEGVLLFCMVMPVVYPLLYSWVYNNEVVREVPVAVVDMSKSAMSRKFVRSCDASPDVKVACYANSIEDAKRMMEKQEIKGFYYIPSDFSANLLRMQQSVVSVYVDMSIMLSYKAIYQTATAVSQEMNKSIQISLSDNKTGREDDLTVAPLEAHDVAIFNPSGGYGSFILPAVLILIIQQLMLLGIGLSAGTAREDNRYRDLVPMHPAYQGVFRIVFGKGLCYFMVFSVWAAYLTMIVPRLFGFVALAQARELLGVLLPYLIACISFGLVVSCVVRYRENVMLIIVFTSIPLLFLSGISWPLSNIPGAWQGISWLFPSTFGIRAFVRINSMGATLEDVLFEYRALWIQAAVYLMVACGVYRHQILLSREHARERIGYIQRKLEIRRRLRERKLRKMESSSD
jgi:ABC-2 type transport system permease protein